MRQLIAQLEKKAYHLRVEMFEMCVRAKTGHVTSSLSCMDILIALYHGGLLRHNPEDPEWDGRDRLILSKGQGSPALYTVLADVGFFDKRDMDSFAQKDGKFGVHLQNDVPGVEITSGSLGHGFGVAAGIALAAKMNRELFLTYVVVGDGELYEGSMWETAMFASHNSLNNLITIVDRNYLCVTDFTEDLIKLEPLEEKWISFGWNVKRIDGHSYEEIFSSLNSIRSRRSCKPLVIIADTAKGEGIESLSDLPLWHGQAPVKEDEIKECRNDLERRFNRG